MPVVYALLSVKRESRRGLKARFTALLYSVSAKRRVLAVSKALTLSMEYDKMCKRHLVNLPAVEASDARDGGYSSVG